MSVETAMLSIVSGWQVLGSALLVVLATSTLLETQESSSPRLSMEEQQSRTAG